MVRLEGAGLISGEGGGAHLQAYGRLGESVEGESPAGCFPRLGEAAAFEKALAVRDECRRTLRVQPGSFGRGPVIKLGRVFQGESFEEITAQEPNGVGRFGCSEGAEQQNVDIQTLPTECDRVSLGLEPSLAQAAAEPVHRFVKRVAGAGFVLVRPESLKNLISGSTILGSQGEIDQEGQVLTPEDLGRRISTIEPGGG